MYSANENVQGESIALDVRVPELRLTSSMSSPRVRVQHEVSLLQRSDPPHLQTFSDTDSSEDYAIDAISHEGIQLHEGEPRPLLQGEIEFLGGITSPLFRPSLPSLRPEAVPDYDSNEEEAATSPDLLLETRPSLHLLSLSHCNYLHQQASLQSVQYEAEESKPPSRAASCGLAADENKEYSKRAKTASPPRASTAGALSESAASISARAEDALDSQCNSEEDVPNHVDAAEGISDPTSVPEDSPLETRSDPGDDSSEGPLPPVKIPSDMESEPALASPESASELEPESEPVPAETLFKEESEPDEGIPDAASSPAESFSDMQLLASHRSEQKQMARVSYNLHPDVFAVDTEVGDDNRDGQSETYEDRIDDVREEEPLQPFESLANGSLRSSVPGMSRIDADSASQSSRSLAASELRSHMSLPRLSSSAHARSEERRMSNPPGSNRSSRSSSQRPQEAKAKPSAVQRPRSALHGSKTAHELYLKTLQEARFAGSSRPHSASNRGHLAASSKVATSRSEPEGSRPALQSSRSPTHRKDQPGLTPKSAQEQLIAEVRQQMLVPVALWTALEVGKWVAALGLPQYRSRFIHQGITGRLLLILKPSSLKEDLQIGVLGHRQLIMSAIQALPRSEDPAHGIGGWQNGVQGESPTSPMLKTAQHRKKLLKDLERVEAHAAALKRKVQGTSRQAELAKEDAEHIRGALWQLDNSSHPRGSPSWHRGDEKQSIHSPYSTTGMDKKGFIPWHPNGTPFERTVADIEKAQRGAQQCQAAPLTSQAKSVSRFLDRVKMDMEDRKHRLKVTKLTLHSPEARFNDPQFSARAYKSDLDSISHKLSRILGMSLDDLTSGKVPLSQTLKGSLRRGTGKAGSGSTSARDFKAKVQMASARNTGLLERHGSSAAQAYTFEGPATPSVRDQNRNSSGGDPGIAEPSASTKRALKTPPGTSQESPRAPGVSDTEVAPITGYQAQASFAALEQEAAEEGTDAGSATPRPRNTAGADNTPAGGLLVKPGIPASSPDISSGAVENGAHKPLKALSNPSAGNGALLPISSSKAGSSDGQNDQQRQEERPKDLSEVLDFLVVELTDSLGLKQKQVQSILATRGEEKKVHVLAAAIKTVDFLDRNENYAMTREERRSQLKQHWHAQEMNPPKPPQGRQQRYWKAPIRAEDREAEELESCRLLFAQAGWDISDFTKMNGFLADEKLNALIYRAEAVASCTLLQRTQGIKQALPEFNDDLEELQADYIQLRLEAADSAVSGLPEVSSIADLRENSLLRNPRNSISLAGGEAVSRTTAAGSSAYSPDAFDAEGSHKESTVKFSPELATQSSDGRAQEGEELKARRALSQTLPSGAHTQDVLSTIIKQLALCQTEELRSLKALTGVKKQLAVYRALLVQRFLHDIKVDTQKRAAKTEQALKASEGKNKKLSKEKAEAFFARLANEGERRRKAREEAVKAAEDVQLAKMEEQRKALSETLLQRRPKSAVRKAAIKNATEPEVSLSKKRPSSGHW